jgi:hypothetical protein
VVLRQEGEGIAETGREDDMIDASEELHRIALELGQSRNDGR